jgi:hypothetical protein
MLNVSAAEGLAELVNESIFKTLDTSGRQPSEVTAAQVVDDLKNATGMIPGSGYLIVRGHVYDVKEIEHAGNDEDGDGPYTIWMVATRDEPDDE